MKTLQFKTNINCGGCIKAVTPTLNQQAGASGAGRRKCWL
jgi:copper chaperone